MVRLSMQVNSPSPIASPAEFRARDRTGTCASDVRNSSRDSISLTGSRHDQTIRDAVTRDEVKIRVFVRLIRLLA
jgi:hypothetical protein